MYKCKDEDLLDAFEHSWVLEILLYLWCYLHKIGLLKRSSLYLERLCEDT